MDRRRTAGALLALAACIACANAAPRYSESTALDLHDEGAPSADGCYYNFQHYGEGDRIMTNEPCLNCTCHNQMLMCYLRVCPFTKPIGKECTLETRADLCCPIITCSDVPVDLLTSTESTAAAEYGMTGVGALDKYGCNINGKFLPEGAKVPPTPNKPCEHCYCIRNMTTCVMQECTLHVDGCTPIYHKDVCCPVRYSCDHTDDMPLMLDDMSTTEGTTPGIPWTTTAAPSVLEECRHGDDIFPDGAPIKTEKPCEHCYCMKGDIVCVVQACGTPMEMEGKNCTPVPPPEGQCCPVTYMCEEDNEFTTTELFTEPPTKPTDYARAENKNQTTPTDVTEGSGHSETTDEPLHTTEEIKHTKSEAEIEIKETTPSVTEQQEITTILGDEKEPHKSTEYIATSPDTHDTETTTTYKDHVLEKESTISTDSSHDESSTIPSLLQQTDTSTPEEEQVTIGYTESDNDSVKTSPDEEKEHHLPASDNITKEDDAYKPSTLVPDTTESSANPDETEKEHMPDEHKYSHEPTETPDILTTISQDMISPEQGPYEHSKPTKDERTTSKVISEEDLEHVTTPTVDKYTNIPDEKESPESSTPLDHVESESTSILTEKETTEVHTSAPNKNLETTPSHSHEIDIDSTAIIQESTTTDVEEHEKESLTTPLVSDIYTKTTEEPDKGLNTIPFETVSESDIYTTEPTKYSDGSSVKDEIHETTTQHKYSYISTSHEISTVSDIDEDSHTTITDNRRIYEQTTTEDFKLTSDETTLHSEGDYGTQNTTIATDIDDNEMMKKQTTIAVDNEELATTPKSDYEESITEKHVTYKPSTEEPDKGLNTVPDNEDLFTTQVSFTSTIPDTNIEDMSHTTSHTLSDVKEPITKKEYDLTTDSGIYSHTEKSTEYKGEDHSDDNVYTTEPVRLTSDESSATSTDVNKDIMPLEDDRPEQATDENVTKEDTQKTDSLEITTQSVEKPSTDKSVDLIENEIPEENVSPITSPGIIPGEGSCLIDGVTFSNNSIVPSTNKCQSSCKCMSSIVKCDTINCSPPPDNMMNCQPVYDTPESCCPSYICEDSKETLPPQPESHMAVTEQTTKLPETICSGTECKVEEDNILAVNTYEACTSGKCENTQVPDLDTSKENECGPEGCSPNLPSTEKMPVHDTTDCIGASCIDESAKVQTTEDTSSLHTTESTSTYSENATDKNMEKETATIMESATKEKQETVVDKLETTTPYYVELEVHSHENDVSETTDHSTAEVDKNTRIPIEETMATKLPTISPDTTEQIDEGLNTIIPDHEKPDSSIDEHKKPTEPEIYTPAPPSEVTHEYTEDKTKSPITEDDVSSKPTGIPVFITESEITDKTVDYTDKPSMKPEVSDSTLVDESEKSTPSQYVTSTEEITTEKSLIDHEQSTKDNVSDNDSTTSRIIVDQETTLAEGIFDKEATTSGIVDEEFISKHPEDHSIITPIYEEVTTSKIYSHETTEFINEMDVTTQESEVTTTKVYDEHKQYETPITSSFEQQSTTAKVQDDHETTDKEQVNLDTQQPVTETNIEMVTTPKDFTYDKTHEPQDKLSTHEPITDEEVHTTTSEYYDDRTYKPTVHEEVTTPKSYYETTHKSHDESMHEPITDAADQEVTTSKIHADHDTSDKSPTQTPFTDNNDNEGTTAQVSTVSETIKPQDELSTHETTSASPEESTTPKFHVDDEAISHKHDELPTHVPVIDSEPSTTPEGHIDYETTEKSNADFATKESVTDIISDESTTAKVETANELETDKPQDELFTHGPISVDVSEEVTTPEVSIKTSDRPQFELTTREPDFIDQELTTHEAHESTTLKVDHDHETTHIIHDELSTETTPSKVYDDYETTKKPLDELPSRRTSTYTDEEPTTQKVDVDDQPHEEVYTEGAVSSVKDVTTTGKPDEEDLITHGSVFISSDEPETTPKVHVDQEGDKTHGEISTREPFISGAAEEATTTNVFEEHEVTEKLHSDLTTPEPFTGGVDEKVTTIPTLQEDQDTTKVDLAMRDGDSEKATTPNDNIVTHVPHVDIITSEPITEIQDQEITTSVYVDHETIEPHQELSTIRPVTDSIYEKSTTPIIDEVHEITDKPHVDLTTQEQHTDNVHIELTTPVVYDDNQTHKPHDDLSTHTAEAFTEPIDEESITTKPYDDLVTTHKPQEDMTTHEPITNAIDEEATTSKIHDDHDTGDTPHGELTTQAPITDSIASESTTLKDFTIDETKPHDAHTSVTSGIVEESTTPKFHDDHEISHKPHEESSTHEPVNIDEQATTQYIDKETTDKLSIDLVTKEPVSDSISEEATTSKVYDNLETEKPDELSTHIPFVSGAEEESTTSEAYVTHETTQKPHVESSIKETVTNIIGEESTTPKEYDDHESHKPHDESTYGPSGISETSTTNKPHVDLETTMSIDESSEKHSTEANISEDKSTSKPYVDQETVIPEDFSTHEPVSTKDHEYSSSTPIVLDSDHKDETVDELVTTPKYVEEDITTIDIREGSSEKPDEFTTPKLDVKETEIYRETTTHKSLSGDDHLQEYTKIPDYSPVTEGQDGLPTTVFTETSSVSNKEEEIQTDHTDNSTSEPSKVASSEQAFEPSEIPEPFTEKPVSAEEGDQHSQDNFPTSGYGQEPDYGDDDQSFGPGTCRYGGKVYVSAQQIPRDDPCDFCFCFRSDIICLQQSCPPPIHGCHEEPIQGFCCPRYECPVSMATSLNVTTTTTTTTTTLPPHFLPHAYNGAAQRKGCQIRGQSYQVGEVVKSASGPCLHCTCGGDGKMKCDPKVCTPEPMLRQMIAAAAVSSKRRR